jgi:hypothetical protein
MDFCFTSIEGEPVGGYECTNKECGYSGRPKEWMPQNEDEKLFDDVFEAFCGLGFKDWTDYYYDFLAELAELELIQKDAPQREWLNVEEVDPLYAALFSWLAHSHRPKLNFELWIKGDKICLGYDSPRGNILMKRVKALVNLYERLVKKRL